MNKYELALETLKSEHKKFTIETATSLSGISIDTIIEACEKAQKYDLIQEKLTDRHLLYMYTLQEVEEWNEYYIKQDAAKEIIEMIDAMCVDEKADVIWQSGAYICNKYIAQKIKERYGIK